MKKPTKILLILLIGFLPAGCSELDKAPSKEQEQSTLMILNEYYSGAVLVDKDTHVMYWMSEGTYNHGTLTLLVDQDGNPKIWDGP